MPMASAPDRPEKAVGDDAPDSPSSLLEEKVQAARPQMLNAASPKPVWQNKILDPLRLAKVLFKNGVRCKCCAISKCPVEVEAGSSAGSPLGDIRVLVLSLAGREVRLPASRTCGCLDFLSPSMEGGACAHLANERAESQRNRANSRFVRELFVAQVSRLESGVLNLLAVKNEPDSRCPSPTGKRCSHESCTTDMVQLLRHKTEGLRPGLLNQPPMARDRERERERRKKRGIQPSSLKERAPGQVVGGSQS